MTRAERERAGVAKAIAEEGEKANSLIKLAEDEDRDNSPEEDAKIREHLKGIQGLEERRNDLDEQITLEKRAKDYAPRPGEDAEGTGQQLSPAVPKRAPNLGEQFVQSEEYQRAKSLGFRGDWKTGQIKLEEPGAVETKATLGSGTTSGGQLIVPDYQAGVVQTLYQRLTVADLIASGQTNSNTVPYMQEVSGSIVNAADAVAAQGTKPESTLVFSRVDEPVKKIATFLPVEDEMLEDVAQIQSYINQRLSLFVKIREEQSLVRGAGTNDLVGITGRSGVSTYGRGTVDSNAVALFKAANGMRGSSFLEPDAMIVNPANWQTMRLGTDSAGQFFGGGPFLGPYGGPQGPAGASQFGVDQIWGIPTLVTTAIGAGTALVGAFRTAAQVFRRSGLSVEASNSHSDFFQKNLTAIRAEERLALAVYRPSAFVTVSGLN